MYSYTVPSETTIESLKVHFDNDGGWPEADKNVNVDYVEIDGATFQTEADTTHSTGTYSHDTACAPAAKQSEWLQCNGHFEYGATSGLVLSSGINPDPPPAGAPSVVSIRAKGSTGVEDIILDINGVTVASWSGLSTSFDMYSYTVSTDTTVESVRIYFTNDAVIGGLDQNVAVDYVDLDDQRFQTEDPSTYSTGTYTSATGCDGGYKESEWLHCNGYLEYEAAAGVILSAGSPPPSGGLKLILDSDMGPDIDDSLALAMAHGYQKNGLAELAAVTISRNSTIGARYADVMNTFYGHPDIPIGTYRGVTPHDSNDVRFTADIVNSGDYPHDVHLSEIPEGYKVMRQVLAEADDNSVVLVQIGFSTNTAQLLTSDPDEISPLSGRQLIEQKVKYLSIMAGDNSYPYPEFNIAQDPASARTVFTEWPVELYQGEGGLGYGILYPLDSVENDFDYITPHVVAESYLNHDFPWHQDNGEFYDMRTWDLISVMAAVEDPDPYFVVSEPGTVVLDDEGVTSFASDPSGLHRSLGRHSQMTEAEKQIVVDRMIELVSAAP
jgi:inosine-uridine nucleoside N-ribohydrolase